MRPPTLLMFAGPNGSGKSTFFDRYFRSRWTREYINADLIARDEIGGSGDAEVLKAVRIAIERKRALLERGVSFATEGIQVDTGLLSLAKERGYRTRVYAIALAEPQMNILRVRQRVLLGGHDVGEVPIVRRYERSLRSMLDGPGSADRFVLIDNSSMRFRELARWRAGRLTRLRTELPAWAETLFAAEFAKHRSIES